MPASVWQPRTALKLALASVLILGTFVPVSAVPPTLNSSGLSPEQCYRRDSDCTRFCGDVADDLRYECFGICDRMLDRCLETGDWTDSAEADPGTGKPPDKRDQLAALSIRVMMILADENGDTVLSPVEIQSFRKRVFVLDAKDDPRQQAPARKP